MTIQMFLAPERANFILNKAGKDYQATVVEVGLEPYGHTEIHLTFPEWMSLNMVCLHIFHLGIHFTDTEYHKILNKPYKPTQYKIDDVMGLAHD